MFAEQIQEAQTRAVSAMSTVGRWSDNQYISIQAQTFGI